MLSLLDSLRAGAVRVGRVASEELHDPLAERLRACDLVSYSLTDAARSGRLVSDARA
jgi:hypothetical protein